MKVKLVDNSAEVKKALVKQCGVALSAIGMKAEGYAKRDCPVDTGRLRNSITNEVNTSEKAVYIGTNVEYAQYVEYMDDYGRSPRKTGKPHFLRDAAANHGNEYKAIAKAALQGLGKTLD